MSYHEIFLEFIKASTSCMQEHTLFLHPHSVLFDQSWENWFLRGYTWSFSVLDRSIVYPIERYFQRAIMRSIWSSWRPPNVACTTVLRACVLHCMFPVGAACFPVFLTNFQKHSRYCSITFKSLAKKHITLVQKRSAYSKSAAPPSKNKIPTYISLLDDFTN